MAWAGWLYVAVGPRADWERMHVVVVPGRAVVEGYPSALRPRDLARVGADPAQDTSRRFACATSRSVGLGELPRDASPGVQRPSIVVLVQSDGSVVLFCASKPGRATQAPESNRTEWGAFGRSLAAACKGAARLSVTRSATIEKAGRFFGWKSRWLVLLSSRLLLYFEDASGCCLCGAIDLERADCDIVPPDGTSHSFSILVGDREYSFRGIGANATKEARAFCTACERVPDDGASRRPDTASTASTAAKRQAKARGARRRLRPRRRSSGKDATDAAASAAGGAGGTSAHAASAGGDTATAVGSTTAPGGASRSTSAAPARPRPAAPPAPPAANGSGADPFVNWATSTDETSGRTFWFHKVTRQTRWEKPSAATARAIDARLAATDDEVSRRAAARLEEHRKQREAAAAAEAARHADTGVSSELVAWVREWAAGKDLRALLLTLHEMVDDERASPTHLFGSAAPGADFTTTKKAYMKALRFIHPDKAPASIAGVAGVVFPLLSEAFTRAKEHLADAGRDVFRKSVSGNHFP